MEVSFVKVAEDNDKGVRTCPLYKEYLLGEQDLCIPLVGLVEFKHQPE